jgi:hypothetical protein
MNKKALLYGLLYCLTVVVLKLCIVLSGNLFSKFGFYYSIITCVFLIIPFFFIAIYHVRQKDYNGYIGGKQALRIALTVLAVGLVGTSIYNYIEFSWQLDAYATWYKGPEFLHELAKQQKLHPDKLKTEDFPKIIQEQIGSLSPFKAATGRIVPLLFIGFSGAFAASVIMKRSPK